jgi:hypothetical protein
MTKSDCPLSIIFKRNKIELNKKNTIQKYT